MLLGVHSTHHSIRGPSCRLLVHQNQEALCAAPMPRGLVRDHAAAKSAPALHAYESGTCAKHRRDPCYWCGIASTIMQQHFPMRAAHLQGRSGATPTRVPPIPSCQPSQTPLLPQSQMPLVPSPEKNSCRPYSQSSTCQLPDVGRGSSEHAPGRGVKGECILSAVGR